MASRRGYGQGSIVPHGRKHRVLVRVLGQRRSLGTFARHEDAEAVLRGYNALRAAGEAPGSTMPTLREWGELWLVQRELKGLRSARKDVSRWRTHVLSANFADWPIDRIGRVDVSRWVMSIRGSHQTRKHCRNLLSASLRDAVADEMLERNVARGVDLGKAPPTDWTFADQDEQHRLRTVSHDYAEQLMVRVAMGTGLRQGEQWALELVDVYAWDARPYIFVQYGGHPRAPTKNGKVRRVPLFGDGLEAMREWLAFLPHYLGKSKNEYNLAFPGKRGGRRAQSKTPSNWSKLLKAAGITRRFRWHDLRHTTASSLTAGWWGHTWRLERIRDFLGHTSIETTQRYAHLAPGVLDEDAAVTNGSKMDPGDVVNSVPMGLVFKGRATHDSNVRPSAPEADALSS